MTTPTKSSHIFLRASADLRSRIFAVAGPGGASEFVRRAVEAQIRRELKTMTEYGREAFLRRAQKYRRKLLRE